MTQEEILKSKETLEVADNQAAYRAFKKMVAMGFAHKEQFRETVSIDFSKTVTVILKLQYINEVEAGGFKDGTEYDVWWDKKLIILTWEEMLMKSSEYEIHLKELANGKINWEQAKKQALGL
jgi:hypothetical protein